MPEIIVLHLGKICLLPLTKWNVYVYSKHGFSGLCIIPSVLENFILAIVTIILVGNHSLKLPKSQKSPLNSLNQPNRIGHPEGATATASSAWASYSSESSHSKDLNIYTYICIYIYITNKNGECH